MPESRGLNKVLHQWGGPTGAFFAFIHLCNDLATGLFSPLVPLIREHFGLSLLHKWTEVNSKGQIVWCWYAKDHLDVPPYSSIYNDGWVHTNAVIRLPNGNTLISLRNFDMVVEVNPEGAVVRKIGEGILVGIHDPEVLPNGNILGALAPVLNPVHAIEIDPNNNAVVWQFTWPSELMPQVTRDTNRLPNGNTLITGTTAIVEVTLQGEIVWHLSLQGVTQEQASEGIYFYKADRISVQR